VLLSLKTLDKLKCLFGFHKWLYTTKFDGLYRICERCGKRQKFKYIEVGQDAYSYTIEKWEDVE